MLKTTLTPEGIRAAALRKIREKADSMDLETVENDGALTFYLGLIHAGTVTFEKRGDRVLSFLHGFGALREIIGNIVDDSRATTDDKLWEIDKLTSSERASRTAYPCGCNIKAFPDHAPGCSHGAVIR